jgi:RNA polymerase sigma-70 factor (ECF subfamily)
MTPDREREARFHEWLREHRGILHKIARAHASTAAEQEELFHDMALQIWRSLPGFREQCRPVTWVYRVCFNTALEWRRGQRRRRLATETEVGRVEQMISAEPRPGWTQEESELLARLYAAIQALPDGERTVVVLSLEGLSYREIGEITGVTENHIGVTLNRARGKLATSLEEVRNEL